ncbi:MAG: hypothetical protein HQL25_03555 [Candidatus Omnitrophica bacterium]|nr:hypothetical protein [Candidatus Omnitrophota bacterium]
MLKLMWQNRKGQNTAEYAILISLVVAGVIAMQQFAQRALQARIRDASVTMTQQTNALGSTVQYEPYYKESKTSRTAVDNGYTDINAEKDRRGTRTTDDSSGYETTKYGKGTKDNAINLEDFNSK